MQLEFKLDWEETQERYRAFWTHEYFGRCALAALSARGLFISTWAKTESEAQALLKNAERWSVADR